VTTPSPGPPSPQEASAPPRLHIVMRSYGGENMKDRPSYYTKLVCLASLIRAAQAASPAPELIFVNDGPIPADREAVMRAAGEVVQVDGGSNRSSYRSAVALAVNRPWADTDLVWFAEDDYLYTPHAFVRLLEGVSAPALADADYFALYGGSAFDTATGRLHARERPERGAAGDPSAVPVGQLRWFRGLATTSSFGVRRRALVQDARLLRLVPYTGGAWDRTSCLTAQGLRPFTRRELVEDLLPFASQPPPQWPRSLARGLLRVSLSARALRRADRRRVMRSADPDQICHLELGLLAPGADWEELAQDTRSWLQEWSSTAAGRADTS
jgi:hypothetical protein